MLGVFAEFETNLRRERQLEGIAKAKAVGEPSEPGSLSRLTKTPGGRQLRRSGINSWSPGVRRTPHKFEL
jgi:DNA invertase Pin-like site-specific DNA recombinase